MRRYKTDWINHLTREERKNINIEGIETLISYLRMLVSSGMVSREEERSLKQEIRDLVGLTEEYTRLNGGKQLIVKDVEPLQLVGVRLMPGMWSDVSAVGGDKEARQLEVLSLLLAGFKTLQITG
jgi:hypothetical protein